jgi:hypothetical protein
MQKSLSDNLHQNLHHNKAKSQKSNDLHRFGAFVIFAPLNSAQYIARNFRFKLPLKAFIGRYIVRIIRVQRALF